MKYTLTPKQMQIYSDTHRELCIFGGIRSGKTNVLLLKMLAAASKPNSRVGLFRKTLVSLKLTTLKSLLEGDGQTPPILPPNSYIHNMSEKTITLKGGGTIVYSSLEEPERIRGMTLNSCYIDEATDLDQKDYITLMGRVSAKMDGVPLQIVSSCNSKGPLHWLAKHFNIVGNEQQPTNATRKAYCLNPADNPFLSSEYLAMLEEWKGSLAYDRDVLGKWTTADGLVFAEFDNKRHVTAGYGDYVRYCVGVDVGFVDAFCALLGGIDQDGNLHIINEVYGSRMNEQAQTIAIQELVSSVGENVENISIDYAGMGASLISNLVNLGLPARRAIKDRFIGMNKVRSRFASNRISINPKCANLLRELQTYEYKEGTEQPKDGNDHSIDALRYLVSSIDTNTLGDLIVAEKKKENVEVALNSNEYYERLWDDATFRKF